jgi:hypothetical protein
MNYESTYCLIYANFYCIGILNEVRPKGVAIRNQNNKNKENNLELQVIPSYRTITCFG